MKAARGLAADAVEVQYIVKTGEAVVVSSAQSNANGKWLVTLRFDAPVTARAGESVQATITRLVSVGAGECVQGNAQEGRAA